MDQRSTVCKDYQSALDLNKNQMLQQMMKRALRAGFIAQYVLGDAWFGTKGNIESVIKAKLTAIFRMKSSNMKYRLNGRLLTADAIFCISRFHCKISKEKPWKKLAIPVEVNLEEATDKKPKWVEIKQIFVVPKHGTKNDYALFLCTDLALSDEQILEVYSLRWSIEVYFKEIKQYMGLLKEQTGNYVLTMRPSISAPFAICCSPIC